MGDEASLIERARAGDQAALGEIYDQYAPQIYAYLYRHLGERESAEDLTAEAFCRMVNAWHKGGFASTSLAGWLYRIAHNLVVDYYRRRRPTEATPLENVASSNGPSGLLEKKQASERLRVALQHLSPDQQQVIVLRFGQGLKAGEVAEVMGKPEGAVRALQHRALTALRRLMEGERR